jgi:hypothetical protein
MVNELITSILKMEASAADLDELQGFLKDHLQIDEDGNLEITAESIRLVAKKITLEGKKQEIPLEAIAYALTAVLRLERQMTGVLQILTDTTTNPAILSRVRGLTMGEEEKDF